MLRRLSSNAVSAAVAARLYTPSEGMKKLYNSDFDKSAFPLNIVPSDSVLFARFLYKAAEQQGNYDVITKDLQTIANASAKLPVFWERNADVENIAEFKKLSDATLFTLVWMQSNGMLGLIPDVSDVYAAYVNAKQKKAVARIYVAPGKENDVAEAKKLAQRLHSEDKELSGYTLTYQTVVDRTIVKGFAVELAGQYVNQAEGAATHEASGGDSVDYTNIPAAKVAKTVWEDNVETEVLRRYLDSMAEYDAEEAKNGV